MNILSSNYLGYDTISDMIYGLFILSLIYIRAQYDKKNLRTLDT